MQSHKHFVVHFRHFVLADEHLLDLQSSVEGLRLNARDLIASQIQLDEVWQASKKAIGLDATELVVVQQAVIKRKSFCFLRNVTSCQFLQFGGVQRDVPGDFLQSAARAVDGRSLTLANGGAFQGLRATVSRVLAPRVISACLQMDF